LSKYSNRNIIHMSILNYILLLSKILGIAFYIAAREMKLWIKAVFCLWAQETKFEGEKKRTYWENYVKMWVKNAPSSLIAPESKD